MSIKLKSTKLYTQFVKICLGLLLFFCIRELFLCIKFQGILNGWIALEEKLVRYRIRELRVTIDNNHLMIWLTSTLVFFGLGVWLYRIYLNLHAKGLKALEISPTFGVLSFLIPLVNFVVPFKMFKEAWRGLFFVSKPQESKRIWFDNNVPKIIVIWWVICCSAPILEVVYIYLALSLREKHLPILYVIFMLTTILRIVSIVLIYNIQNRMINLEEEALLDNKLQQ